MHRVLDYGQIGDAEHQPLSLDPLIRDTLVLVRLKCSQKNIRLVYEPNPKSEPIVVNGNKGQLQQIFLNLILNAFAAVPEGGEIKISLGCHREEETRAVIEFSDNGTGIPVEMQKNIFDSFFSGRKEGTGLGLAIVKGIVQSHRGKIEIVQSSPSGTTFRLKLPLTDDKV